jgi:tight adherence protein C
MSSTRPLIALGLITLTGVTLLLSEFRWFRRVAMADRLSPYFPGSANTGRSGLLSVASFRDVIAPLSRILGERLASLFGVNEELGTRLRRIHSPLDVTTFRVRQLGWTALSFLAGALLAVALGLPAPLAMLAVFGTPILTFLLLEQQVAAASASWQRRLFLELPVVSEQLGMLMSAGWSLSAACNRISSRGTGACSADLRRVVQRTHQGLTDVEALREWSELADVDALNRLVSVLALDREAADLGRLISEEARSIRRESHRETIESIERRNEQVWIPVTVAALIPGVLLMGIPFIDALTLFSSS